MSKYIFLDSWVLSDYTKAAHAQQLAHFIQSNGYTIVFNGLSMTEVYNPGWKGAEHEERGANIAQFLGGQHCVVIEPEEVWNKEAVVFPHQLSDPPINLNLDEIPVEKRVGAILQVLRRYSDLITQSVDVGQWSDAYKILKSRWLNATQQIIENGIRQGLLIEANGGSYKAVCQEKREEFLRSLDWRFTTSLVASEHGAGENTAIMRGSRFSNLCFWYQYVSPLPDNKPKLNQSDIGDIFQLSLLPYCHAFTVDTKMFPTVKQALKEAPYSCQILTQHDLDMNLGISQ
jgi:hypothetical protein